jgi:leucyl-tRNA synthetase
MPEIFDHKKIDKKWQDKWEKDRLYETADKPKKKPAHAEASAGKQYVLDMFPYPSGAGLHVGHPEGYTATDILSRFLRMRGHDVLHPMGWDAFGLPAENYAIKQGIPPWKSIAENIDRFREQIKSIGLSYDWSREINTSEPSYYRWTQWLFLQLYQKGLAYKKEAYVNWCPKDQTVLANEQVVDGCCDRCGTVVIQKLLSQWFFRITDYADRLLNDLDKLDWPEPIKLMQKNWIGRSEGAEIDFEIKDSSLKRFVILHGKHGSPETDFIPWLKTRLEKEGHEVIVPELPNTENPNDLEQFDFVKKNVKFDENTVILGHSFGGIVALRLLEQGIKVQGVILAATPATGKFLDGKPRPTVAEAISRGFDFEKIKVNSNYFKVLVDLTDKVVRQQDGPILADGLSTVVEYVSADTPHFNGKEELTILNSLQPKIKVFTTRPDTIFGATYMVLAPEHPLVQQITTSEQKNTVEKYIEETKKKTELQRTALEKEKTGVFTGAYAINPATKEAVPVWMADYVLATYGTGAIMAVPEHDERDAEFAKKYKLPIVDKPLLSKTEAIKKFGKSKIQYKLRDWLVSRQRYWGAPIPIIYCDECGMQAVPEKDLPVELPTDVDFLPTGESPIARSKTFHQVKCPNCGGPAKRDSDTMDTFVDSSWYFFRFTDPHNDKTFADKKHMKAWLPVDTYVGGAEHAVLHLLYARFFTKALHDLGFIDFEEPFMKLRNQGLILGPDGEKMSKSRGNVVNPDDVIGQFGADAFRMYEMFMGPLEEVKPWQTNGIVGVKRFLDKVWRYQQVFEPAHENKQIHKLVKKITSDIDAFKFNTAIAAFMEFLNENKQMSLANWETFLILLAPFAPHVTEELWHQLKHKDSIHLQVWPKFDTKAVVEENITVVVQVLGRVRTSLNMPAGSSQEEVKKQALADENVKKHLEGKEILKEIFIKDKLINFVVK